MKKQIATLTSGILNPFLVGLGVILVLSFESTSSIADGLKWSLILIAVSILPIFLIVVYLVHKDKLEGIFINVRRQRNKIYVLATFCTVAGFIILFYLGAPLVLVASFVAGLSAILIFMLINLLWKISVHTAFVAASVTALTILYGSAGAVTAGGGSADCRRGVPPFWSDSIRLGGITIQTSAPFADTIFSKVATPFRMPGGSFPILVLDKQVV